LTAPKINSIRTIYWFHFLEKKLRLDSALALQRLIDPRTIKKDGDKELHHSSKWSEYCRGIHKPGADIIDRADIHAPGSAAIMYHLLWEVLERKRISPNFSRLLAQLKPEIQLLIVDMHGQPMLHTGRQFLGKLERRASIDTLAALTLLMRVNHERERPELVWEYAHSIFRVLLILGNHFKEFNIAEPLFKIFVERIFPLANWGGKKFSLESYAYYEHSTLLFRIMELELEVNSKRLTLYDQSRVMLRLLEMDAYDKRALFAPRVRSISEPIKS